MATNQGQSDHGSPSGNQNEAKSSNKNQKLTGRWSGSFKGATPDMNRKVFQLQSEYAKKGQFEDTLEALQRYVGHFFPMDLVLLLPFFKNLEEPTITPNRSNQVVKSKWKKVAALQVKPKWMNGIN